MVHSKKEDLELEPFVKFQCRITVQIPQMQCSACFDVKPGFTMGIKIRTSKYERKYKTMQ